jgi:DNA-directed RNA polymerase specialized sigma24 family protein
MVKGEGAAMENNCAIDQTEIENLSYEFSDEALKLRPQEEVAGSITLLNVKRRKLITERRREGQPLQKIAADLGVDTTTV